MKKQVAQVVSTFSEGGDDTFLALLTGDGDGGEFSTYAVRWVEEKDDYRPWKVYMVDIEDDDGEDSPEIYIGGFDTICQASEFAYVLAETDAKTALFSGRAVLDGITVEQRVDYARRSIVRG